MATRFHNVSSLFAAVACFLVASATHSALADIVNGDFSSSTLANGTTQYQHIDDGWHSKNAGTNWTIQPGQFLEQLSNSGTATRAGQVFSAGDMSGTGWSLEFDLAVDQILRVQVFAGLDDGNNTATQNVMGYGGDGSPNSDRVVGNWTTLIDTNPTNSGANNLNPGHIVIPFPNDDDLSGFDLMAIRFRGNGGTVTAQIDNVVFVQEQAVPEPTAFALAALGLLSLGFFGRRRRRKTVAGRTFFHFVSEQTGPLRTMNTFANALRRLFRRQVTRTIVAAVALCLLAGASLAQATPITASARSGVDVGTDSNNANNGGIFSNSNPPLLHGPNPVGTVTTSVTNGNGNGLTPLTWTFNVVDTATLADFDFDVTVTALHDNTTGTWTIGDKRGSAPAVNSPGGSNQERNRTEALNAGGYAEYMRMSVGNVQVNSGPDIVFTGIEAITLTSITAVDTGTVNASSLTNDPGAAVITTWANQTPANNRLELPLGVSGVTSVDIIPTADWHQLRGGIFNFETVEVAVPEPSTLALAGLAMLPLFAVTFRRRTRNG